MAIKCKSCGGVYDATTADGGAYFHACAPLRRLRVDNGDGTYSTVVPGTEGARPVVGERAVDRANARNENLAIDPSTGAAVPIAVGGGVSVVNDNQKA